MLSLFDLYANLVYPGSGSVNLGGRALEVGESLFAEVKIPAKNEHIALAISIKDIARKIIEIGLHALLGGFIGVAEHVDDWMIPVILKDLPSSYLPLQHLDSGSPRLKTVLICPLSRQ